LSIIEHNNGSVCRTTGRLRHRKAEEALLLTICIKHSDTGYHKIYFKVSNSIYILKVK